MPTSSFKYTTKNPNPSTPLKSTHSGPHRRSRSVSAFSRTHLDVTSDFHNKTDNPLFWVDTETELEPNIAKFDEISCKLIDPSSLKGESRRGRPVLRSSGGDGTGCGRKDFGRSLCRVDTGRRRRSVSRGHYGNYESDKELENTVSSKLRSTSKINSNTKHSLSQGKTKISGNTSDLSKVSKGWNTWSSQHPAFETSDESAISLSGSRVRHLDEVRSASSFSEVEEKTIKPVSEEKISHMKVDTITTGGILETVRTEVRRAISDMQYDLKHAMPMSNSDIICSSILSDIAPELANANAVECMEGMRREYVKELEECEERTRKLRAELAGEDYRELELNNILSDNTPEPMTPQGQNPRPVRKASMERRKVSRRLEEEAMAYFDECVSISTFDDSDFSSLEDPPSTAVRLTDPGDGSTTVSGGSSRANPVRLFENQDLSRESLLVQCDGRHSILPDSSNRNNLTQTSGSSVMSKTQLSFSPMPSRTTSLEQDIRNLVKNFSKDTSGRESSKSQAVSSGHRNTEDITSRLPEEKFLLERMNLRSRIESGNVLLCGGHFGFSMAPFSSVFW